MEVYQDKSDNFDDVYFKADFLGTLGAVVGWEDAKDASAAASVVYGYPINLGAILSNYEDPILQSEPHSNPSIGLETSFPSSGLSV